jgi:hypothetical protein
LIQIAIPDQDSVPATEIDAQERHVVSADIDSWLDDIHKAWPEPHGIKLSTDEPIQNSITAVKDTSEVDTVARVEELYKDSTKIEFPTPPELLYTPDPDDYEPQWDEPGGQLLLEDEPEVVEDEAEVTEGDPEELSLHMIVQKELQAIIYALVMADNVSREDIATAFTKVTDSWDDFLGLMDQLRLLAPLCFKNEVDISLTDEQLLEQIGRKLFSQPNPEPDSSGNNDHEIEADSAVESN